jgi:hypothetical protein
MTGITMHIIIIIIMHADLTMHFLHPSVTLLVMDILD